MNNSEKKGYEERIRKEIYLKESTKTVNDFNFILRIHFKNRVRRQMATHSHSYSLCLNNLSRNPPNPHSHPLNHSSHLQHLVQHPLPKPPFHYNPPRHHHPSLSLYRRPPRSHPPIHPFGKITSRDSKKL